MDFGYNRYVYRIYFCAASLVMIMCSGCDAVPANQTATPDFVTAVLPFTPAEVSTPTITDISSPVPAASEVAAVTAALIEGTTTTQLNVRSASSTASVTLGTIGIFTKVQVSGKDASGSWYQIIYAEGYGWVRAEFVQVDAAAAIPVIGAGTGPGSAVSGLVIQKINVRNGPATTFETLGVLNPNDVVFINGRDPGGAWMQIEFANAPDGTGWVASEFLQMGNTDALPIIGATEETPTGAVPELAPTIQSAIEDGDSMQAPLSTVNLSATGARAIQVAGNISAPEGDTKDWIQFSADSKMLVIEAQCSGSTLQMELWNEEALADTFSLPCGNTRILGITPNEKYFLSISEPSASEAHYTEYILKLETHR